ncbi:HNH endonuclease signature motif containing protein [Streptomyces sp. NPDC060064]|uniref:HNH endonuclease signature motif containing protein n=1 Tax=Streptomyces sp. NPDC060064 TaxID=3347049 RepID=UPI0036A833C3
MAQLNTIVRPRVTINLANSSPACAHCGANSSTLRNRLLDKAVAGFGGCLIWTAYTNRDGYGHIYDSGRMLLAHRVAYEVLVGPIPDGLQLDHLCRVRHCINPHHLEPVTAQENQLRSGLTIGGVAAQLTHCLRGHEFTPENIYSPPSAPNKRFCRACLRIRKAEQRARRRSAIEPCGHVSQRGGVCQRQQGHAGIHSAKAGGSR